MKKKIGLLIALIAVICISGCVCYAEEPLTGKCGENITYRYDESTATLYVEGSGKMYDKTYEEPVPVGCIKYPKVFGTAKHIVISDNITYIGKYAFHGYNGYNGNLESVSIGKDVRVIGVGAFGGTAIKEITIPDGVNTISERAFADSYSLEKVNIGKSVRYIGEFAFYPSIDSPEDYTLKKVTVPESVEYISDFAFGYANYDYVSSQYLLKDFVLSGKVGSAAYDYCQKNGISFDDIDGCEENTHKWGGRQTVREKVCGKSKALYCNQCIKCGSRRYERGTKVNHNYLKESKTVIKKATHFKEGQMKRYCTDCDRYITTKIAKRKVPSPKYTVKIGKNQITFNFTNKTKYISYYKVTVYSSDKKGNKDEKIKTYTVKNKKLTVKNLEKNKKYHFVIKSYYKSGGKTAASRTTASFRTLKK